MAIQSICIEEFLRLSDSAPILDVRSPGEYRHAHIPGANSLPLFTDEERKEIGSAYKQVSREKAIKIGLDAFGPKMRTMVEMAEKLIQKEQASTESATMLVHCWRGGMRSSAVAWLLDFYGFNVYLLEGGYKAYRQWVIGHWQSNASFQILSGFTGAGKTEVLTALKNIGVPVIDLEGLAKHKGSAFGGLDKIAQPAQEMFENLLAGEIERLKDSGIIWVEDESQRIGDLNIPHQLFQLWQCIGAQRLFLNIPFEQRLERLTNEYGHHATEHLINAIVRIKKRLGPLETKTAIAHLVEGNIKDCFRVLLEYYDKHYGEMPAQHSIDAAGLDATAIAHRIQSLYL